MRAHLPIVAALSLAFHLPQAHSLARPIRFCTIHGSCEDYSTVARNVTLSSSCHRGNLSSSIVLDYSQDVTGYPTFYISSTSGANVQLEVKYAETRAVLDEAMADGPLAMAAAMDSYRVKRYNLQPGKSYTSKLLQGGFRYQKFTLLSSGHATLADVGVQEAAIANITPVRKGDFSCSDEALNDIWRTGARTIQLSSVPQHTIPDFWNVTSNGSVVESLIPQVLASDTAAQLTEYNLYFEVQPTVGGFGLVVLASTLNEGIFIDCDASHGTVNAYSGSTNQDAKIAGNDLPANVTLNVWHSVAVQVSFSGITMTIDGTEALHFTQTERFFGSFGLGASLGHTAIFRNLNATMLNGDSIYANSLTDSNFLSDFSMGINALNIFIDGSKRDRIAYAGDLDIELTAAYATGRYDAYAIDTIDLMRSFQAKPGFFVPTVKVQTPIRTTPLDVNITGLIGYSFNFVLGMTQAYQLLGNCGLAERWAPNITAMLDWANSQTLSNGLFNLSQASFGGDWNYYDPPQSGVVTKFNTIYAQLCNNRSSC